MSWSDTYRALKALVRLFSDVACKVMNLFGYVGEKEMPVKIGEKVYMVKETGRDVYTIYEESYSNPIPVKEGYLDEVYDNIEVVFAVLDGMMKKVEDAVKSWREEKEKLKDMLAPQLVSEKL